MNEIMSKKKEKLLLNIENLKKEYRPILSKEELNDHIRNLRFESNRDKFRIRIRDDRIWNLEVDNEIMKLGIKVMKHDFDIEIKNMNERIEQIIFKDLKE